MNVRLKKRFNFYAGLVHDGRFFVNHYDLGLSMFTATNDHIEQNISYDRLRTWIHEVLDDSILIGHSSPVLSIWQSTNSRLIVLPEEPVDQVIGIMLYSKLNAIMEDRMIITDVEISSTQGDHMRYLHSQNENIGAGFQQVGWWSDPSPSWYDVKSKNKEKVVNLSGRPEWKDYGLDWTEDSPADASVVFAKFNRDDDQ